MTKNFFFINPRGMCAGVERALTIIDRALEKYGSPLYVNHEIVHNEYVIAGFEKRGVIFCISPEGVPKGAPYIFSAHGVSPELRERAKTQKLISIDATCPLVEKVHTEAKNFSKKNFHILYIGHKNHPEAEGVMGISDMTLINSVETAQKISLDHLSPDQPLTLLTQTTLSIDETATIIDILKTRFPNIIIPKIKDICYATQNRQDAVKQILPSLDMLLVVGSPKSSNSVRLVETALQKSKKKKFSACLVPSLDAIPFEEIENKINIGITSGASVPEELVQKIFSHICKKFPDHITQEVSGRKENMVFRMPKI